MTLLPDPAQEAQAFLARVREDLGPTLHRSTVPVISQRDGGRSGPTVVAGSGILVAVDDARFLVSAAHVFRQKTVHGAALCIPTDTGICEDIGGDLCSPEDKSIDIGVLRLKAEMAAKIEKLGAGFVRLGQAQPIDPDKPPDGGYVIYGYPSNGAKRDAKDELVPVPHYLGCIPYRGSVDRDLLQNYNPKAHALLSFQRQEMRNQHTGAIESFPEPYGMSGGGVWWAYSMKDATRGWLPEYGRLVAIQSGWYPDPGILCVVPIQFAKTIIAKGWPDYAAAVGITGAPRP